MARDTDYMFKDLKFGSLAWPTFYLELGESPSLCISKHRRQVMTSHREGEPGHYTIIIAFQCPKNYLWVLGKKPFLLAPFFTTNRRRLFYLCVHI